VENPKLVKICQAYWNIFFVYIYIYIYYNIFFNKERKSGEEGQHGI
jgi:hypothetical protein